MAGLCQAILHIPLTVQHARLVHSSIMSALAKEGTHGTSLCTCACVLSIGQTMAEVSQLTCSLNPKMYKHHMMLHLQDVKIRGC
jgi:hypothetical protein